MLVPSCWPVCAWAMAPSHNVGESVTIDHKLSEFYLIKL